MTVKFWPVKEFDYFSKPNIIMQYHTPPTDFEQLHIKYFSELPEFLSKLLYQYCLSKCYFPPWATESMGKFSSIIME